MSLKPNPKSNMKLDLVQICKALGDENRLRILAMLTQGERCACELLLQLQITQPTLSHHMKILCDCNLVQGRKAGKWIYYSISAENSQEFLHEMEAFLQPLPAQNLS